MSGNGLTRDEMLILLIEECGEVIQAATKCLRFGWERNWQDYGINCEVLAGECGDVLALIDALPLNRRAIERARRGKIAKADKWKGPAEAAYAIGMAHSRNYIADAEALPTVFHFQNGVTVSIQYDGDEPYLHILKPDEA